MEVVRVPVEVTFPLRSTVLGWTVPLMRIDHGDATHLALVDHLTVIAVVSHTAWPCPGQEDTPARYFWAMAVEAGHQRWGIGRSLLDVLADHARASYERLLWADARESALGFYTACGADVSAESAIDDITGLTDHRVIFTV